MQGRAAHHEAARWRGRPVPPSLSKRAAGMAGASGGGTGSRYRPSWSREGRVGAAWVLRAAGVAATSFSVRVWQMFGQRRQAGADMACGASGKCQLVQRGARCLGETGRLSSRRFGTRCSRSRPALLPSPACPARVSAVPCGACICMRVCVCVLWAGQRRGPPSNSSGGRVCSRSDGRAALTCSVPLLGKVMFVLAGASILAAVSTARGVAAIRPRSCSL